jgi:2,4-dienoyl-CoA reductase-like NADH-dependent reductase (Old Yellow Enzyme family)
MYQPAERVRHTLPIARVPTAGEAAKARLFSSIQLPSGLTLQERTWIPAMVPWRATADGMVTPEVVAWYRRFAEGQPGAIVVEATGIREVPSGPLLRIGHERFEPGLAELVQTVREASGGRTRLLIQIIDFLRIRRRPSAQRFLGAFLPIAEHHRQGLAAAHADERWIAASDSEVREALLAIDDSRLDQVLDARELEALRFGARERVWDLDLPHVRQLPTTLPGLFAEAAGRAQRVGFDGVELHYAHAYTMASFLSARNRRPDGYGVSLEGRVRLPLEVLTAVRQTVGENFTVGCRMLCDEIIDGGSHAADTAYFATEFARAGMDFVSLSTGGKFEDAKQPRVGEAAYPYTGRSGWECMPTTIADARGPFGRNVPKQAAIRRAVREAGFDTPVVICGGIRSFDQAEGYLADEAGDIVAAARQSLADPDWFRKLRLGRGDAVRACIYRNYCEALDQKHRQVTCQLWDRLDLDAPDTMLTNDRRRRLVAPAWSEELPEATSSST